METVWLPILLVAAASCATAPASRSPLRERLEASGNAEVEAAVKSCLKNEGWKVDDVGGYSAGANVVTAYKAKDHTDVYIFPPDQKPRISGGPDGNNPFWKCVANELGGGGAKNADQDKSADHEDTPPDKEAKEKDKDKGADKKGAP
jgi:hypothetical protein